MLIPLVFAITLCLSSSPVLAGSLDLNDFMADHRADMQRQYEQQRAQWQAEEQAAYYRQQADAQRMNQPSTYENSRDYSESQHFNLWMGNDPTKMQACAATKYDVSCY